MNNMELFNLVCACDKAAEGAFFEKLKMSRARWDAEEELIKDIRKTRPGLARFEVLASYGKHLDVVYKRPDNDELYSEWSIQHGN